MAMYAEVGDLRASLRIADDYDDALLTRALDAAGKLIDAFCGRTFSKTDSDVSRLYVPTSRYICNTDDIASDAPTIEIRDTVSTDWVTWTADTDYVLEPINGLVNGIPWPITGIRAIGNRMFMRDRHGAPMVRVTGTFGWATVPVEIQQATILQASRLFKRNDSPLGVAGWGEIGALRVLPGPDVDVRQLVSPYTLVKAMA